MTGGGGSHLDGRGLGIKGILEQLLDHRCHGREDLPRTTPNEQMHIHPEQSRWCKIPRISTVSGRAGRGELFAARGSATNLHRGDSPAVGRAELLDPRHRGSVRGLVRHVLDVVKPGPAAQFLRQDLESQMAGLTLVTLAAAATLIAVTCPVHGLDNGLGRTPPLGWSVTPPWTAHSLLRGVVPVIAVRVSAFVAEPPRAAWLPFMTA